VGKDIDVAEAAKCVVNNQDEAILLGLQRGILMLSLITDAGAAGRGNLQVS
jgi:hypothetical protein